MRVESYLYFNGRCEEAIGFYKKALGAEVDLLTRFKDEPSSPAPEGAEDKVLHADLRIGETRLRMSDGECSGVTNFQGFSLSLATKKDSEANRLFAALSDGGTIQVPLISTPFASRFGMVADRFGVSWTIVTEKQPARADA